MTRTPLSPPLSPSFDFLRDGGSGLGAAVDGCRQLVDGVVAAGEAKELVPPEQDSGAFDADALDAEDAQPQQGMPTPELPPRAVVEQHRIEHWPPRSWCDECSEGHGRERRHGQLPESH